MGLRAGIRCALVGQVCTCTIHGGSQSVSVSEDPADPCKCKVTAKRKFSAEVCKCKDPVTDEEVDAFSVSVLVYPDGLPESGKCVANGCPGENGQPKDCVYKAIEINLTIAECARACTGHPAGAGGVSYKREFSAGYGNQPSAGSLTFGGNHLIRSAVPNGLPGLGQCGSGPFKETYTFLSFDQTSTVFSVWFEFACGQCTAVSQGGG